jgi:hypothetical protein
LSGAIAKPASINLRKLVLSPTGSINLGHFGGSYRKTELFREKLPNLLDNASQVNESIESIGKKITALEATTIHDSQNLRIGKLEESMETLSSIFSSFKFKKEKAFVGKEQKFMFLRLVRLLVQLRVICRLNHLRGRLKCLVW